MMKILTWNKCDKVELIKLSGRNLIGRRRMKKSTISRDLDFHRYTHTFKKIYLQRKFISANRHSRKVFILIAANFMKMLTSIKPNS